MAKLKLTSPWHTYYNELKAFFREDPQVTVLFDEDDMNVKILVRDGDGYKAEALSYLLITEQQWGDTKLTVTVVPANAKLPTTEQRVKLMNDSNDYVNLYTFALNGNDEFSDVYTIKGALGYDATYVVFEKNVIQYYTDNLGDLHGIKSTLAENIARDIFVQHPGAFFCTEVE